MHLIAIAHLPLSAYAISFFTKVQSNPRVLLPVPPCLKEITSLQDYRGFQLTISKYTFLSQWKPETSLLTYESPCTEIQTCCFMPLTYPSKAMTLIKFHVINRNRESSIVSHILFNEFPMCCTLSSTQFPLSGIQRGYIPGRSVELTN